MKKLIGVCWERCIKIYDVGWRSTLLVVVSFVVGFALAAVTVGPVGPEWLTFKYWRTGDSNTSNSEIFRNLFIAFVAFIGFGFGAWRTWTAHRQTNIAAQGLGTERFDSGRTPRQ